MASDVNHHSHFLPKFFMYSVHICVLYSNGHPFEAARTCPFKIKQSFVISNFFEAYYYGSWCTCALSYCEHDVGVY